mgnify:CR=1 FL=1
MIRLIMIMAIVVVARARTYDLVVLAGQSNAQGWASNAKHYPPSEAQTGIPLYYEFPMMGSSEGKWIQLGPQPGRFPKGHFGPEVSFASELASRGQNPAIFKFTLAGSSLETAWKAPGQGGLYDQMCRSFDQAVRTLRSGGHQVRLRALIWIQGEADAIDPGSAARYEENLTALVKHFRARVAKNPRLPVLLGVDEKNPYVVRRPIIVAAQENVANRDARTIRTSMLGLKKADRTHLKPKAVLQHGKRLADAYFDLISRR